MAVLPNYTAGAPPVPNAPGLEGGQMPRIDAGRGLAALDNLARTVAGGAVALPNAPGSLGQGGARGMMALGEGVQQLGQMFQALDRERAEARNVAAVHEATLEMERIAGDFTAWREKNPDPARWEEELQGRLGEWSDRAATIDLSPVAREEVTRRFDAFSTRLAIDTRVSSVKAEVARAREALEAGWVRAVDSGDAETAVSLAREGVSRGWFPEDTGARMEIEAVRGAQQKARSAALMEADTMLNYGDAQSAYKSLENARWAFDTDEEFAFHKSELETKAAVQIEQREVFDRAAEEEGGPVAIARELEARDNDGNPTAYPALRGATRKKIISDLYEVHFKERESTVKRINEAINSGMIRSIEDAERFAGEFALSPIERAAFEQAIRGEIKTSEEYIQTATKNAFTYNPGADPNGTLYGSLRTEIAAVLDDDPRAMEILDILEKRRAGQPLELGQKIAAQKQAEFASLAEAEGAYRLPVSRIRAVDQDGAKVYVDTGADIKPGDPGFFETGKGWFDGSHVRGRVIELSQDDRLAVEEGKKGAIVEDLAAKNRSLAEAAKVSDELTRRIDSGQIQTEEQANEAWEGLVAPRRREAVGSMIEGTLFPPSLMEDPTETADWLDSYPIP